MDHDGYKRHFAKPRIDEIFINCISNADTRVLAAMPFSKENEDHNCLSISYTNTNDLFGKEKGGEWQVSSIFLRDVVGSDHQ